MNKTMRTRNLDPSKPMAIYDSVKEDLPDRVENPASMRAANLPTGMEKEEELEHHLQLVLSASQKFGDAKSVVIPVPDSVQIDADLYQRLYPEGHKKPEALFRVQGLGAKPEPHIVDYCIDEEDHAWLKQSGAAIGLSTDKFEMAIDCLEKYTGARDPTEADGVKMLVDEEKLGEASALAVYRYWSEKRKRLAHPLISRVRTENKRDAASGHDPYVAFRKRAEKMQTRKNRKHDELNYVIMFKMKIAHTSVMKDGLMDMLKSVRERETLKLRTTLMERHEFHLSNSLFDDGAGEYYAHMLANYPMLNRIEADIADDLIEDVEDFSGDGSVEDMSEISESDSQEASSWSEAHLSSRGGARSPRYDIENDPNLKDFPAPLVVDPNLVSESQYRDEEPPEYWGPDGRFTFVPRRDCRYYEVADEPEMEDNEMDSGEERFFLQEIPVVVDGVTVLKTVCCCRSYGLGGVPLITYYKLPEDLASADLELLGTDPVGADLGTYPDKNVFQKYKGSIYTYSPQVSPEPDRNVMSTELLEEIYKFALTWTPAVDLEPPKEGEEILPYQIACTSVFQPFSEHSYFDPVVPPEMEDQWFLPASGDAPDLDMEDLQSLAAAHVETGPVVEGSSGISSSEAPAKLIDSAPPSLVQTDTESLSTVDSAAAKKTRKIPARGRQVKGSSEVGVPLSVGVKRPRPTKAPSEGKLEAPKPVRKKTKPNNRLESVSGSRNGVMSAAALSMPPALLAPAPVLTGLVKNPPVKRSLKPAILPAVSTIKKTGEALAKPETALQSGCSHGLIASRG